MLSGIVSGPGFYRISKSLEFGFTAFDAVNMIDAFAI